MFAPASAPHPLDTELLDLVEGTLNDDTAQAVEAHLAACVICRIKRQRLSGAPPVDLTDLRTVDVPSFGAIEVVDRPLAGPHQGELWLTEGDDAVMVLIHKVLEGDMGLVVVPVTFDAEIADSGTLVLDANASPLGVPLAIYDGMRSSLPARTLRSRVAPFRVVDLLQIVEGDAGVTRGTPLDGPGDARHEVRQYIADRLTALSPLDEDDEDEDDLPPAAQGDDYSVFRRELDELRADDLTVEDCPALTNCPSDWVGLGRILRRYQTIAVIGTPAGLATDSDYTLAARFLLRENMSALVVCPRDGETVDLYLAEGLYDGYALPGGEPGRATFLSGFGLRESVQKFLSSREAWNVPAASDTPPIERVDIPELLAELAREEASGLATDNFRTEKRAGWARAAARGELLASIIRDAQDGSFDPARLADLANEDLT